MRRGWLVLLPMFLGLSPAIDGPVTFPQGDDPAQFVLVGIPPESIAIDSGEVRLDGQPLGYFATRKEYRDYVLTFEYRYDRPEGLRDEAEFRGNSGVLLHSTGPAGVWPLCVQVQLAQFDPGAIFAMNGAACEAANLPDAQAGTVKPVGEWNQVEVTCRGGAILSRLNGVEVGRAEQVEPSRGAIGWQSEGKPVRFRKIRITPLPAS